MQSGRALPSGHVRKNNNESAARSGRARVEIHSRITPGKIVLLQR